ncbi:MAG: glycosyltransferase [Flavobacterium sp.]
MRIIQIIDSLDAGGAEKMAVTYANALSCKLEFSGLVATRREGDLKSQISQNVDYLFLKKKQTIDFKALLKLKSYCKKNRIDCIQAHSSSFFTAVLLKIILPKIKIIWHDHYGNSDLLNSRKSFSLKLASLFFEGIIVVNQTLKTWAEQKLFCNKIIYLPNFITDNEVEIQETNLKGIDRKRILCLANLRKQKDHLFLIEIVKKINPIYPDWTFHLVGKDFEDKYSKTLKSEIKANNLENSVFIYGTKNDIGNIINQAEITILTSQSEGLPVALLEYGAHKKAVVTTAVGQIRSIIEHERNGFVVPVKDVDTFSNSVVRLIENPSLREKFGVELQKTIRDNYSEKAVIDKFLKWI